jgi:hypothetical protein
VQSRELSQSGHSECAYADCTDESIHLALGEATRQHGCRATITPGWHVPSTSSRSCTTRPCHPIKNRFMTQNQACQVEEQSEQAHMATHWRHQNSGPILSFRSSGQSGADYWCGGSESLSLKRYMEDLIQQTIRPIIKVKSDNIHFVLAQRRR